MNKYMQMFLFEPIGKTAFFDTLSAGIFFQNEKTVRILPGPLIIRV
jgi:hypothetical protein